MYGLSWRELRFALLVSSSHFTQHVFYRILPPLIPVLAVALDYPLWQLGLLITLYSLGMGVVQAPFGVLSDRIDRRYLLPTGLALAGAAYVLFAFAPTLGASLPAVTLFNHSFEGGFLVMSLAMVIVGIGLAVVHPAGYPMITDNVETDNKGKVLGVFGASSKFGDAATPALVAVLLLVLPWERIILLFGVAGIVYGIGLYAALRSEEYETMPSGQRTEGSEGSTNEILDRDRRSFFYPITAIYLFFVSSGLTSHGINAFLPAFLVAVYAYSFEVMGVPVGAESVANVYFALVLIAGAVVQLYLGGLLDRYDPRLILMGCMAVATVGLIALAMIDLPPLALAAVIVVLGTGLYGVNPARDALISDLSPPDYEGRIFGYLFTATSLVGAAFPTVIGYLLEVVGMRQGFLMLAIGTILAGGCIALLYSDRIYRADADTDARTSPSD
jgi:FSR family fosmidomycin resistance protein-like MFS transporter